MGRPVGNRPRLMRSAKRYSGKNKAENISLMLLGGLLVAMGMMLRG